MPKDAKLGLVVGVGLVILVGVFYCRTEDSAQAPAPETFARPAPAATPPPLPLSPHRPLVFKSTAHSSEETPVQATAASQTEAPEDDRDSATEATPAAETDGPEYRPPARPQP